MSHWYFQLLSAIIICLCMPKLLFSLISIIGRGIGIFVPTAISITNYIALAILIINIMSTTYGFIWGWRQLTVKRQTLEFANLPKGFDNYRIVQISDFHVGSFGNNTNFVYKIIDTVNKQNPDLIVFTGDIVDMSAYELKPFTTALSQMKATDGVISILGNHDYCTYGEKNSEERARNLESVKRYEQSFGWKLLLNDNTLIRRNNDSIAIVGVENCGKGRFPKLANLPQAMKGLAKETFTILLSHDPSHWRMEVLPNTSIPLTLSGHTHAMQFQIGKFSPASWVYPEWHGLYINGNQQLYVSSGVGATLPFRLGAWPEIVVLTLKIR